MNYYKNLLLPRNKISYRNKKHSCNCCNCPTTNCQCLCYCKCHFQILLLPINNNLENIDNKNEIHNKEKRLLHYNNITNNIMEIKNENSNKENENSNINKNSQNINLIKQKILNINKSQAELNKLLKDITENKSDYNTINSQREKESKICSNYSISSNDDKYNTLYNFSKLKNQTDRNNYFSKNQRTINNNNYLLSFISSDNINNKKKKNSNNKTNKPIKINDKTKEKLDNNLINNYISESKHFIINKNESKENNEKKQKTHDLLNILKKYEKNKINFKNKNFINLEISNFDFSIINNGLHNEENEKLIKIYEKKISQLEQKLLEAYEKIDNLTKISINNESEILLLKDELNQKNNKIKLLTKNNHSNILGRNNDSLIVNLNDNFQKIKLNKGQSLTDDNSSDIINKNNSDITYRISQQNNSIINDCIIYRKKKSSKIFKKTNKIQMKRSFSQPNIKAIENSNINYINKINKEKNLIENNNNIIYTIYPLTNSQKLLYFNLTSKNFSFENINSLNSDNFTKNYLESFRKEESQYNSIYLFHKTFLYILTGKNSDIFYKYDPIKNIMEKICNLKNNHANGVLIYHTNKIFCLSGKYNKKVEVYFLDKKHWEEINEMNIERSCFSACIINDKFLFCLFGYNTPTNKYLDSIEFCDISNLDDKKKLIWNYLKYKNYNSLNMNICGFVCMNYKNEKIIIFGGLNGIEKRPVDKFFQIILDNSQNFENENTFIEETNRKENSIYKNKCYYFHNGLGNINYENNYSDANGIDIYAGFDNNFNVHVIQIKDKLIHDVYFFNK